MASWVLGAIGVALLVDLALWHRAFARALTRARVPARRPDRYASITVIRPVRGLDVDAAENFRAALATTYPGEVETLFVLDEDSDPALPVLRQVVADHHAPGRVEILFAGARPAHRTGKLHAMIAGMERARGTLIAFGDSDTRPTPGLLTALVDALMASPDVGATFAPVVVADPPRTAGDVGYALMLNALYGPGVARAAGASGRLPFIMGQIMVFRPEALAAIGGPACAEGQFVDDMYIGRCLDRAGYANVMIDRPLAIVNRGTSARQFLDIYRRWVLFGQNGIPFRITWPLWLRGIDAWLAMALIATSLAAGAGWAAVIAATALVAQGESLRRLHARFGGASIPLRLRWVGIALFLVAPLVVASMRWRRVEWRGRAYALRRTAGLAGATRTPGD
ncbi:MAG: glycosyltransferase [Kofleriaceae bacterium]